MTAPGTGQRGDPVRDFREALPTHIRAQLYDTQRAAGLITAATGRGWTVAALAAECSRSLAGVVNAGGVITSRLEHCAHNDPPVKAPKARPEWCGQCDPATRHTLDDNRLPGAARCPQCHPLAKENPCPSRNGSASKSSDATTMHADTADEAHPTRL